MTTMLEEVIRALPVVLSGLFMTVSLTGISIIVGLVGGTFLGMWWCKKVHRPIASFIINRFIFIMQGLPVIVLLLVTYFVIPHYLHIEISPVIAGGVTLSLYAMANFAATIKHEADAISQDYWDSCKVLGYTEMQAFQSVILPQVLRRAYPTFVHESISLMKETYVVSIIGTLELTKAAMNLGSRALDPIGYYCVIAFLYLGLAWVLSAIAVWLEKFVWRSWSCK